MAKKKITNRDDVKGSKVAINRASSSESKKSGTKKSSGTSSGKTKSKSSSAKSNGSKAKKGSLSKARESLASYFEEANKRASRLKSEGIYTKAILNAEESLTQSGKKKYEEGGELFNINAYHYADLQREAARVKEFLNDETSTPSESEMRQAKNSEKYGDIMGRDYYAMYGVNYDVSRLDTEKAKLLFSAYRKLEEANAAIMQGRIGYGSDTLINDLLDLMVGDNKISDYMSDEDLIDKMVQKGQEYLTAWEKERENIARRDYSSQNWDYGALGDMDQISKEDFLRRYGI